MFNIIVLVIAAATMGAGAGWLIAARSYNRMAHDVCKVPPECLSGRNTP